MNGADQLLVGAPALPGPALYGGAAILTMLLAFAMWRSRSWAGRFIGFAVWSRYIMAAFHLITFPKLVAGLSLNAIGSIGVLGLGLLVVQKRHLMQLYFLPCYLMMAVIFVSGVLNHNVSGILTAGTKFGYLLVVAVSLYEALGKDGEKRVMNLLLFSFAPLLLFQAASVALHVVKAGESDGSVSYIGGFYHEAAFSIALATCLLAACFATGLHWVLRGGLIAVCLVGIYLANYRTTILGIAPLVFAYFALPGLNRFYQDHKVVIRYGLVLGAVLVGVVGVFALQERFKDLSTAFSHLSTLIKPPDAFTREDKDLLSGRPYIWSGYLYAYQIGSDMKHIFGFGPESWSTVFAVYAHNTLVSYLYEYGIVGVMTIIYFWTSMMYYAFKIEGSHKMNIIAAHASFFVLNMATMPLWQIEGNIFYGLLCGYTLYQYRLTQRRRTLAAAPVRPVRLDAISAAARTADGRGWAPRG